MSKRIKDLKNTIQLKSNILQSSNNNIDKSININNLMDRANILNDNIMIDKFKYDFQYKGSYKVKNELAEKCLNYIIMQFIDLPINNLFNVIQKGQNNNVKNKKSIIEILSKCIAKYLILK